MCYDMTVGVILSTGIKETDVSRRREKGRVRGQKEHVQKRPYEA